jgi:mRNA interferase RelE/StbE
MRLKTMKTWTVKWLSIALNDLERIDNEIRKRILKPVLRLELDPYQYGEPLGNKSGFELSGFYKLKVGGYRVVYHIVENKVYVIVIAVGKREGSEVYGSASARIRSTRIDVQKELKKLGALLADLGARDEK